MIFAILDAAANKGELLLVDNGMCHFVIRRDGIITIHEIIVLPQARRKGIAKKMIDQLRTKNPGYTLRSLCPIVYESNKFWKAMGFTHSGITYPKGKEDQKEKGINVWLLPSTEERAPTQRIIKPVSNGFVLRKKSGTI